MDPAYPLDSVPPAEIGHLKVHGHEVIVLFRALLDGFQAIPSLLHLEPP